MAQARIQSNRFIFRLSCLIIVPMLLLALGGVYALVQDRRAVLTEAKERSQGVAEEIARRMAEALPDVGESGEPIMGWLDAMGNLIEAGPVRNPADFPAIPQPVQHDTQTLDDSQLSAWKAALIHMGDSVARGDESGESPEVVLRAAEEADLPSPFHERVVHALGSRLIEVGDISEGVEILRTLPDDCAVRMASGIPVLHMSMVSILQSYDRLSEGGKGGEYADDLLRLCDTALRKPSFMTPKFLEIARASAEAHAVGVNKVAFCQERWEEDQLARAFFQSVVSENDLSASRNQMSWVRRSGQNYLLRSKVFRRTEPGDGESRADNVVRAFSEEAVLSALGSAAPLEMFRGLPGYANVEVRLAGRLIVKSVAGDAAWVRGGDQVVEERSTQVLGQGVSGVRIGGIDYASPVDVRLMLGDRGQLYARQNVRLALFGGVLIVALIAGGVGLFVARRAFLRQQQLNEMQSNFVSSVSHELRAPIASVRLMAEGLDTGRVGGEGKVREYHRFIVRECGRLSSLIENVLDFSRIERKSKDYEFAPTDLQALLLATHSLMLPVAKEAGVKLTLDSRLGSGSEVPSEMVLDGRAIQQALVNLIDNAIKHSPGDCEVIVSAMIETDSASKESTEAVLWLSVADWGPGIPKADRARIFERFHRLGSELRRETTGVGIGLSIVKHIVEAHQGTIRIDDNSNGGSTFVIRLPVVLGLELGTAE